MKIQCRLVTALSAMTLLFVAATTEAGTWRVELDGSGDFTVLQDAVDAAAEGDTVLVGAGQFDTIRPVPDWDGFSATMAIQKGGLVVEGQGAGSTIIGANYIGTHYRSIVVNSWATGNGFTLRHATVIGGYNGLHYQKDQLLVENCEFTGSTHGIATFATRGAIIRNCSFHDMEGVGLGTADVDDGSWDIVVEDSDFARLEVGFSATATSNAVIRRCRIVECIGGVDINLYSSAEISDCEIIGIPDQEHGVAITVSLFSEAEISHCTLDMSMAQPYRALRVSNWSDISGTGNTIRCGGYTSMFTNMHFDASDFTGNEIYKADRFCLEATHFNENLYEPPLHLDMTDNYWGTSDPDSIAAWIDDHYDHHPQDAQHRVIVDFLPYLEDPVPVEPTSLGDVRGLFR